MLFLNVMWHRLVVFYRRFGKISVPSFRVKQSKKNVFMERFAVPTAGNQLEIDAAQHTRSANRRGATYQKRKSTRRNTPETQIDAAQHTKSAKTHLGNFRVVQNAGTEATWTLGFTHSASCMLTVYGHTHTDVAEVVTIIFT